MRTLGSIVPDAAGAARPPFAAPCVLALGAWFARAAAGDRVTYWRGTLAFDLWPASGRLDDRGRRQLAAAASFAWSLSEQGLAHLVQRRLGPDRFEYILEVRPRARRGAALTARPSILEAA